MSQREYDPRLDEIVRQHKPRIRLHPEGGEQEFVNFSDLADSFEKEVEFWEPFQNIDGIRNVFQNHREIKDKLQQVVNLQSPQQQSSILQAIEHANDGSRVAYSTTSFAKLLKDLLEINEHTARGAFDFLRPNAVNNAGDARYMTGVIIATHWRYASDFESHRAKSEAEALADLAP